MSRQVIEQNLTDRDSVHIGLDRKLKMLESATRILSERYDIQIVFSKEGECKTTERVMTLPYDPALDEALILGLAGHEIGHLIHTDFEVLKEIGEDNTVDNRHLLFNITNTLEDVRIEIEMEKEFPGFVALFKQLTPYTKEYKEPELPNLPALQKVLDVLYLRLRNYDSSWYEPEICDYTEAMLLPIGTKIYDARNTRDVLKISREVYDIITKTETTETAHAVATQAAAGAAGGPSPEDNLERLDGLFDDRIAIRTGNEEKESKSTKGVASAHGRSRLVVIDHIAKQIKKETQSEQLSKDCSSFRNAVKEIVTKSIYEAQKERDELGTIEYNVHPVCIQRPEETEYDVALGSSAEYTALLNSVKREIAIIKKRLQQIVNNESYARWNSTADRGARLNRKMLHKIPLGERNVFRRKSNGKVQDVAFTLLVDESGSMIGDKIIQAQRCAVMFSEILDSLGMPFETIGFSTCDLTEAQKVKIRAMSPRRRDRLQRQAWDRADNLRHSMYKRFDESYRRTKTRLVHISRKVSNYDQDHVEFGWDRLKARPESRKVLIVISDSLPCGGPSARQKLRRIVNQISSDKNAECIAIGIQAPHLAQFYHKYINIEDASQLGINVVRLIESAILTRSAGKAVSEIKTSQSAGG